MNKRYNKEFILKIQERKKMMDSDDSLLIDGTLDLPGPFDSILDTISSVVKASEGYEILQVIYNITIMHKPKFVLELGTNLGISSSYIAAALKAVDEGGILHTVDASPYKIQYVKKMHEELMLDNVLYTSDLFENCFNRILELSPSIDMAFVDGQHLYKPTMYFFERISEKASPGSIIIFDDIKDYSPEMNRAWRDIRSSPSIFSWANFNTIGWIVLQ